MKTVLVNPPWFCLMGRSAPGMPLGIACIAAVLREAGHATVIFDGERAAAPHIPPSTASTRAFFHDAGAYHELLRPDAPLWDCLAQAILAHEPRMVGITVWSGAYPAAMALAHALKKRMPSVLLVAGGVHATLAPATLLEPGAFDYAIAGEGEAAARKLWDACASCDGPAREAIAGVWWRDDATVHDGGRAPLADDLDALPMPDYTGIVPEGGRVPVAGIMTSRGCPFRCGFCASEALWTSRVRYRSVDAVLDELAEHHTRFGVTQFRINDDSFCLKAARVEEFCRKLTARFDLGRMRFWIDANESTLTPELIRMLEKAGCRFIAIGIESAAPRIREAFIRKKVDLDHARELVAFMNTTRIVSGAYFMTGFPEETEAELMQTVDWMRRARPANPLWGVLAPYPGTELSAYAQAKGILPEAGFEHFMHHSVKTSMAAIAPERHAALMESINAESDALVAEHRRRIARLERYDWIRERLCHPIATMRSCIRLAGRFMGRPSRGARNP